MQTFSLVVDSNANGSIVASAINYWQTLAPLSGSIAVGFIVQVKHLDAPLHPTLQPRAQGLLS